MTDAVLTAHEGMVSENWSNKNVEAYMRVNGLNSKATHSTNKCAGSCKLGEVSNEHNMIAALKAMVGRTMSAMYTAADIDETE